MSKKIALINGVKTWGGGEKWHLETAIELNKLAYDIEIITNPNSELDKKSTENQLKVNLIPSSKFSFINPLKIFVLIIFFKLKKYDTIILNLPSDLKLFGLSAKLAGIKKIIYRRGSDLPIKNAFYNKFLLNNICDIIICNSKSTAENIKITGVLKDKNKIKIIPNFIDFEKIKLNKIPNSRLIIGNAGRLVEQKNQIDIINLAIELKKRKIDFQIKIAGEGKLRQFLEQKIKENQLENYITLLGEVKDMSEFFNSIDIFVLTSKWEGFGYVIAEAMSYELPVVAYNISSNPELVNSTNGILIEPFNIKQLSDRIIELYNNKEKMVELGRNGRNYISNNYSKKVIIDTLLEIL